VSAFASGRELWPFAALSASYFAFIGYLNPYLPLWLKALGFGTFAIGSLVALQSVTRMFAPYAWGWLSDRTGHRVWLTRIAAGLALVCSLGLLATPHWLAPHWLAPNFGFIAIVLFAMFANTSALMPMTEATIARLVSDARGLDLGRYGRVRVWGSIGFLVTVLAAGFWFERFGIGAFVPGALLLLVALNWACWRIPAVRDAAHSSEPAPPLWPVLRQPAVQWFFASLFFMVLAHIALYAFFSLYLDALGHDKRIVGLLWGISVLVEIGWLFFQGRWMNAANVHRWLIVTCSTAVLRFAATAAFGSSLAVLVVAQALHALTFAAHHSVCIALVNEHFPGRLRARGQALFAVIGYGFPGVLGGVGGGLLSERWGLASVFWAAAGAALIACLCAARVVRR
jgi:PPP family 3-phenylpropionic acid transporter